MVGAAAGDALGSPVKVITRSQIKDLYGKKGILKLSPEKHQKERRRCSSPLTVYCGQMRRD